MGVGYGVCCLRFAISGRHAAGTGLPLAPALVHLALQQYNCSCSGPETVAAGDIPEVIGVVAGDSCYGMARSLVGKVV